MKRGKMWLIVIGVVILLIVGGNLFIRNLFCCGIVTNIKVIDDRLKNEMNKLFVDDQKIAVYLTNQEAQIKQGKNYGVAWAVKNLNTSTTTASRLDYTISVINVQKLMDDCGINKIVAMSYLKEGYQEKGIQLPPGQISVILTRIQIPSTASVCTIRYNIDVKLDGQNYTSDFFDVTILSK